MIYSRRYSNKDEIIAEQLSNMMIGDRGNVSEEQRSEGPLDEKIEIHPNIRIQKNIIEYLTELTSELRRLERIEQDSTVLDNIRYLLELTQKLSPE